MVDFEDTHIYSCDRDKCLVCHSKLSEMQEWVQKAWFVITVHAPDQEEQTALDAYE